jgi:hypothetical protein
MGISKYAGVIFDDQDISTYRLWKVTFDNFLHSNDLMQYCDGTDELPEEPMLPNESNSAPTSSGTPATPQVEGSGNATVIAVAAATLLACKKELSAYKKDMRKWNSERNTAMMEMRRSVMILCR